MPAGDDGGPLAVVNGHPDRHGPCCYRTLMAELANLDTLRHIHVENHVLLPRFLATA